MEKSGILNEETEIGEYQAKMEKLLKDISKELEGVRKKRDVLFLPFRYKHWDSMSSVWGQAKNDPSYNVLVMPIPWVYRDYNGMMESDNIQYDGGLFPDEIPIVDYHDYDFLERKPEMIIIQSPYDEYNSAFSIDPFFYSKHLRQFTEKLIYIPWFRTNDIDYFDPNEQKAIYNMRYYVTVPGVIRADLTILPYEKLREAYIEVLTEFAGSDSRGRWEKRIVCIPDDEYSEHAWTRIKEALVS